MQQKTIERGRITARVSLSIQEKLQEAADLTGGDAESICGSSSAGKG
jgi:uncharacterized protein (DUF1778 family)